MDLFCLCVNGHGTCNSPKLVSDIVNNISKDAVDEDVMKLVRKILKEVKKNGCYVFAEIEQSGSHFLGMISELTDDEEIASKVSDILCHAVSKLNESDYFIPKGK